MLSSESIAALMPALIKAQSAFAPAVKAKVNPHFKSKYVPLDAVIDAIAQPLRDNGIAIVQQTDIEDARTVLITRLVHESGEWIAGRYPVHPVKADPQGEGSALTYARRYALMAIAGIAPEDDDGNAAVRAVQTAPSAKVTPLDGAWDAMGDDQQEFLLKVAAAIGDHFKDAEKPTEAEADSAHAYITEQNLEAEEKMALWTRLGSKVRAALKKANDKSKKEAA